MTIHKDPLSRLWSNRGEDCLNVLKSKKKKRNKSARGTRHDSLDTLIPMQTVSSQAQSRLVVSQPLPPLETVTAGFPVLAPVISYKADKRGALRAAWLRKDRRTSYWATAGRAICAPSAQQRSAEPGGSKTEDDSPTAVCTEECTLQNTPNQCNTAGFPLPFYTYLSVFTKGNFSLRSL